MLTNRQIKLIDTTFPLPQYQLNPVMANTTDTTMTTINSGGITTNFGFEHLCPKVEA